MIHSARRHHRLISFGVLVCLAGFGMGLAGCAHSPERTSQARDRPLAPVAKLGDDPGYEAAPVPEALHSPNLAGHMRDDAPQRYVVQRGDTLWDISRRYLDAPWLWPQLWQANPDIDDPDRIYPGDVLVLTRGMDGQPRLSREQGTVRLSPEVRVESLPRAIATIPADTVRTFLNSPRRVDTETLRRAPYVVAVGDGALVAGTGALLYIRGLPETPEPRYALVRPAGEYADPYQSGDLGARAIPVGEVEIERTNEHPPVPEGVPVPPERRPEIATAYLVKAKREARPGDRLLPPADPDLVRDFHPRTPAQPMRTRIVSVYGGISQIGRYDVVALDNDGPIALTRGDVLDIYQAGQNVVDPITEREVRLPERHAGRLMVFDQDQSVSYALVLQATRAIHVGDIARSPSAGS